MATSKNKKPNDQELRVMACLDTLYRAGLTTGNPVNFARYEGALLLARNQGFTVTKTDGKHQVTASC